MDEKKNEKTDEKKKRMSTAEYVQQLALPLADELGLKLWDVVFLKEGADWFLRLFIDKDGGVGIEDCVNLTKALNPILDELDPIPQEYTLEVSSCGINRKLTKLRHFEAFLEHPVLVKLIRPMEDGKRELEGILIEVYENGDFEIAVTEETTARFTKKECSSVQLIDEELFEE